MRAIEVVLRDLQLILVVMCIRREYWWMIHTFRLPCLPHILPHSKGCRFRTFWSFYRCLDRKGGGGHIWGATQDG